MEEVKKRIRELIGEGILMGYDKEGVILLRVLEKDEFLFSFLSHDLTIVQKDVEYEGKIKMGDTYFLFKRNGKYIQEKEIYNKKLHEKMIQYNLYLIHGNEEWKQKKKNHAQNLLKLIWIELEAFVQMDYSKKTLNKFRLRWLMENETICNK